MCCAGLFSAASAAETAGPQLCFAEGTPTETVAAHTMGHAPTAAAAGAQAANAAQGWTETAMDGAGLRRGEPITLTWSVVPDGTAIIPALMNEGSDTSSLRAFLAANYGDESVWRDLIQSVLDAWSDGPGIGFVYEPNDDGIMISSGSGIVGVRGDIRFAGHDIDGDNKTVAYAFFPAQGGDVVIDVPDAFNTIEAQFRNVLAHESGHAIGLGHTCPADKTKLMEPIISTFFSGPQFDDLLGAHRSYGDFEEENDRADEATDLGLVVGTTTTDNGLALDGSGDEDWFLVPPGSLAEVSINLAPLGSTYMFGETSSASCSGVATLAFDASSVQDLIIEVVDADRVTTLASADATGAGGSEALVDVRVSKLGGYIRIAGGGVDGAQMYEVEVVVVPEPSRLLMQGVAVMVVGLWLSIGARQNRRVQSKDTLSVTHPNGDRSATANPPDTPRVPATPSPAQAPCSVLAA